MKGVDTFYLFDQGMANFQRRMDGTLKGIPTKLVVSVE